MIRIVYGGKTWIYLCPVSLRSQSETQMAEKINILLLAHDAFDLQAVSRALREAGYDPALEEVRTREDLAAALRRPHDLYLGTPDLDGMALPDLLAMLAEAPGDAPFVAMAPGLGHERGTEAVRGGAFDYCSQEDLGRLPATVHRALRHRTSRRECSNARQETVRHKAMQRELFLNSPEAIAIMDERERVVDVNPAFTAMFGYTPEEASGVPMRELIVPPDKLDEYLTVAARIYQGKITRVESVRRGKSGRLVRVSAIGIPVEMEGGGLGVYAVYSDVTARMRALDALRRAESNYRNFFMNAVEGMYVSTPLGRFVLANPALADLLGYDSPSQVTDSVRSIGREIYADASQRERFLAAIRETDEVRGFTARIRRPDGSELDVVENVRAVRDEDGDLLYFQGTMAPA